MTQETEVRRGTVNDARQHETGGQLVGNTPNQHRQLTSPEPTTSNEENKQVSMPVSRRHQHHAVPFTHMSHVPYSHADTPFKFPHRNSGVPPIGRVACSVTNLSTLVSPCVSHCVWDREVLMFFMNTHHT